MIDVQHFDIAFGAPVLTLLDMWPGCIAEDYTSGAAYITMYGKFDWHTMPFDLCNCLAMLKVTMNRIPNQLMIHGLCYCGH